MLALSTFASVSNEITYATSSSLSALASFSCDGCHIVVSIGTGLVQSRNDEFADSFFNSLIL